MEMYLGNLLLLAQAQSPGTQPDPKGEMIKLVGMLGLMAVMFYFVAMRPQQKRAKEHAALLKAVKAGDKITTTSGILGVVLSVKEKTVTLRSADAKLEITKAAIAEITERGTDKSEA
jgi:preprotein translocase subunit YajC